MYHYSSNWKPLIANKLHEKIYLLSPQTTRFIVFHKGTRYEKLSISTHPFSHPLPSSHGLTRPRWLNAIFSFDRALIQRRSKEKRTWRWIGGKDGLIGRAKAGVSGCTTTSLDKKSRNVTCRRAVAVARTCCHSNFIAQHRIVQSTALIARNSRDYTQKKRKKAAIYDRGDE